MSKQEKGGFWQRESVDSLTSPQIDWKVRLPKSTDPQNVVMAQRSVQLLMRLGGISFLRIQSQELANHLRVTNLGLHADGTATGVAAADKPSMHGAQFRQNETTFKSQQWSDLTLQLDTDALRSWLRENGLEKDEAAYILHLNTLLSEALKEAAINNLLHFDNFSNMQKFIAVFYSTSTFLVSTWAFAAASRENLALAFALAASLVTFFAVFVYSLDRTHAAKEQFLGLGKRKTRFTFFPGYEVDRAVLIKLLAARLPLLRLASSTEQ